MALRTCAYCDSFYETDFALDAPAEHADALGTEDDPCSPGDHWHCCDQCCYGEGHEKEYGP